MNLHESTDPGPRPQFPLDTCFTMLAAMAAAVGVGFLIGVLVSGREVIPESDREQKLLSVLQDQVEAWNRGDLDGFMQGYWKDERMTFCSGDSISRGWQAAFDRYRKRYQAPDKEMGKLEFKETETLLLDPRQAVVRGAFHLTLRNGAADGLFTLLLRRIDGRWRIVYDHTSAKSG